MRSGKGVGTGERIFRHSPARLAPGQTGIVSCGQLPGLPGAEYFSGRRKTRPAPKPVTDAILTTHPDGAGFAERRGDEAGPIAEFANAGVARGSDHRTGQSPNACAGNAPYPRSRAVQIVAGQRSGRGI